MAAVVQAVYFMSLRASIGLIAYGFIAVLNASFNEVELGISIRYIV
jgi:hypothetical protein